MTEASIAVVNTISNYPIPLTDRWGDYTCRTTLLRHWNITEGSDAYEAYEHLRGRYDSGEIDTQGNPLHLSIGDPRAFQHEEVTFIAFHEGRIGIHAELELEEKYNEEAESSDYDELTKSEFEEWVAYFSDKLKPMAEAYPETKFFIAHGEDVTYKGRVTINAFTPLLNGRLPNGTTLAPQYVALMVSPYFRKGPDAGEINITKCPCLEGLTEKLIDIALER